MIILTRARRYVSLSLSLSNLNEVLAKFNVLNFVNACILCTRRAIFAIFMLMSVIESP